METARKNFIDLRLGEIVYLYNNGKLSEYYVSSISSTERYGKITIKCDNGSGKQFNVCNIPRYDNIFSYISISRHYCVLGTSEEVVLDKINKDAIESKEVVLDKKPKYTMECKDDNTESKVEWSRDSLASAPVKSWETMENLAARGRIIVHL